jgi:hypothetical protein
MGKMCTGIIFTSIWLNLMATRAKLCNCVGKFLRRNGVSRLPVTMQHR